MTDERTGAGERADLPRPWAAILAAVGAVCGLGAYVVIDRAASFAWQLGPSLAFVICGLAFCLSVDPRRWVRGALVSLGLAVLVGLLATTAALRFGTPAEADREWLGLSLVIEALIVAQVSLPFVQTWQEQGRPVFPYVHLFAHAWNNSLIVALSAAFAGLFWLILWLFAMLFSMVGLEVLERLIEKPGFAWPATATVVAVGISAARNFRRVVVALRRIVFSLFSVLTPLYLALSIVFLIALVFGGFEKLAAIGSASATFAVLLIIGIVLINAILRDGSKEAEAARMLDLCAVFMAPALLGLCGFAAYAIFLRIDQYGQTPDRIRIAVTVAVLGLYCLAYVAALAARSEWMKIGRRANTGIAGIVVLVAVALQTPWADPYRLSAESQYRRLASGAANAETFDYGFLKFELGAAGIDALERIARDSGEAPPEVVARQLAGLERARHAWEWHQLRSQEGGGELVRSPAGLDLPEDLPIHPRNCGELIESCMILAANLTDGPGTEYVYATMNTSDYVRLYLLERDGGEWRRQHLRSYRDGSRIFQALREGRSETVPADHHDLRIGDEVIRLRKSVYFYFPR